MKTNAENSRRNFIRRTSILGAALPFAGLSTHAFTKDAVPKVEDTSEKSVPDKNGNYTITIKDKTIEIIAGNLVRNIDISGNKIRTKNLKVANSETLAGVSSEFKVSFWKASPNRKPAGLILTDNDILKWADGTLANKTGDNQPVSWKNEKLIDGEKLSQVFKIAGAKVTSPKKGTTRLTIRARSMPNTVLDSVTLEIFYEIYQGYPAIRKWISFTNNGGEWLKINNLFIDDITLANDCSLVTALTPEEQGAESSVVSFSNLKETIGIIAASEIPSAPRKITKTGAMGYNDEYFEWVIGPSESFISEPVVHYAYSGQVIKTSSGVSKPLDRANEGPFKLFLQNCVGLRGSSIDVPAPIWCSYTNFLVDLTDTNMREQADIAARIGFTTFQLDEGWAKTPNPGGSEPDTERFPDFDETCRYINSKGLQVGLWISCFRGTAAKDIKAMPDGRSLPIIINSKRGQGMSFSSQWRHYFANDMIYMRDRYNMTYVKEDLTNISRSDLADNHDSRTKKESYLRGLRGLFESNKILAEKVPDLWTQITHEIYWRTPGPPADIAALKYGCAFHTTPNTYLGAGNAAKRVNKYGTFDPLKLRADLIKSCAQARNRYYEHRGIPAYSVEFYAANAVNVNGSLTQQVQDRQICSWLMGAPTVFAGDLSSLTEEHILHYRKRFDLLKTLQNKYNIYGYFQYSGVPVPTDTDWHWWGKLNTDGYGAVVIIRGSGGDQSKIINIPWAHEDKRYRVHSHFIGKDLGVFKGKDLIEGKVELKLPQFEQEILELSKA
jgi:hypothetical protein